jgi:RHS repeat-associated protein
MAITSAASRFLFTAREFDPETHLYHYRARAYDQDLGRFTQFDPIDFDGDDVNLSRYVSNNSLNWIDAMGLGPGKPHRGPLHDPGSLFGGGGGRGGGAGAKPPPSIKNPPKPSPKFKPPTNPPSQPPDPSKLPPGIKCYVGKPTEQYPDGYWKLTDPSNQRLDPRTMKPGPHPDTHVPLPKGYKGPFGSLN